MCYSYKQVKFPKFGVHLVDTFMPEPSVVMDPPKKHPDLRDVPCSFPVTSSVPGKPGSGECFVSSPVVQVSCEEKNAPGKMHLSWEYLVSEQKQDPPLYSFFDLTVSKEEEANMASGYFCKGHLRS